MERANNDQPETVMFANTALDSTDLTQGIQADFDSGAILDGGAETIAGKQRIRVAMAGRWACLTPFMFIGR